jgi:hypothetical protein
VLDYIDLGVRKGTTITAQAPPSDNPEFAGGYFIPLFVTGRL